MICPSQDSNRARSSHFVLLGFAGMMLAYSGCAAGRGSRTGDANAATADAASVSISDVGPAGATETPAIKLDPKLLGAKPSPRQQAKKLPQLPQQSGNMAPDSMAPVASTDSQPEVVTVAATPPAARAAPAVNQVDNRIHDPVGNANFDVARSDA